MMQPLFVIPIFRYECKNWIDKKQKILEKIDKTKYTRSSTENFNSDRGNKNCNFKSNFIDIFSQEINQFCNEIGTNFKVIDAWSVDYNQNDFQGPHNHRSHSYSGILYVEYDSKEHEPTLFIAPWNDPIYDGTQLKFCTNVKEGTIIFFPSFLLHYAPLNKSNKKRIVVSFDLLPTI
jgi:hypothetical protein